MTCFWRSRYLVKGKARTLTVLAPNMEAAIEDGDTAAALRCPGDEWVRVATWKFDPPQDWYRDEEESNKPCVHMHARGNDGGASAIGGTLS